MELVGRCASPVSLDVVFVLPGEVFQPDFGGLLQQRFRPQQDLLRIEVALLEPPSGDPSGDLLELLGQVIDMAESYARCSGIAASLQDIRGVYSRLARPRV